MTTIPATITVDDTPNLTLEEMPTANAIVVTWEAITNADQGGVVKVPLRFADKTIQVVGTFTGSATYSLQGAFAVGGPFVTCLDAQGNAMTFGANSSPTPVPGNCPFYRILRASGSAGADADVFLSCITNR